MGVTPGWAREWWVGAGPVFRTGLRMSVTGSSYVQGLGMHDSLAAGRLSSPGEVGPFSAYADREYDDGYVKLDPGTGSATTIDPNTTWNWGFDNLSQYNAGAQTLTFHATGEAGYTALESGAVDGQDETFGMGVQLLGGLKLKQWGKWSVDVCLGFQGLWGDGTQVDATTYGEEVRQMTITDTYDVTGVPAAQFAAGYQGTYFGNQGSDLYPTPVIPNLPQSRITSAGGVLSTSYNSIALDMDQSLLQIALGPRVGWAATRWMVVNVRPTVSVNIIDMDVNRTEVFVQRQTGGGSSELGRWTDQVSHSEVLMGLGIAAGVDFDLGKGFFAGVFGGYEWLTEDPKVSVGPNTVTMEASGFVAGAVLGKRF